MASVAELSTNTRLAGTLVRILKECGEDIEMLRAEQVLGEVREAWPGNEEELWTTWLAESCESLELRAQKIEATWDEVKGLAIDGAIVAGWFGDSVGVQVVVGGDRRGLIVGDDPHEHVRQVRIDEFQSGEFATDPKRSTTWIVIEHPEVTSIDNTPDLHHKPIRRLLRIIRPEWTDIWMILVFALVAGILNLATPIAVESLVNTVSFGTILQPVLVLAFILFGFLAFAAMMRAMQTYVAEIIQRRLFTRVAADLAYRLPRVEGISSSKYYTPELVNRFLDVVTLQKVVANILLDGINIVLATFIGMAVLAFYHPWLLGFDILLLTTVTVGILVLGRGAITACIDESKLKYKITSWFEDVARCESSFKAEGGADYAFDRANQLTAQYLKSRRYHFSILFRQIVFTLGLQAVAGTVLLGVGGWLVIQGQLTLGQLVAAELIVTTILASLAKLGKHLEGFYDVVAAMDKLGYIFDLPVEKPSGLIQSLRTGEGLPVMFNNLRSRAGESLATKPLTGHVAPGERVAVIGEAGSGKTMLSRILYGSETPASGSVEIKGNAPRDIRPDVLRCSVALASEVELFEASLTENICLGRPKITSYDVRAVLDSLQLTETFRALPDGLETKLLPNGTPLSSVQQKMVMIARAVAGEPELVIIDGLLDALPKKELDIVVGLLLSPEEHWTVIVTTSRPEIAALFDSEITL